MIVMMTVRVMVALLCCFVIVSWDGGGCDRGNIVVVVCLFY